MPVEKESTQSLEEMFAQAAREYAGRLTIEDFMEATPQARQREITLASLSLVTRANPKAYVFNELLVQKRMKGADKPLQVVPDNMVVLHDGPLAVEGGFDIPLQPATPFLVMEYVSASSKRKDYEENAPKYEKGLQVPYYLIFHPDIQEVTLFRLARKKHVSVKPNKHGRYAIQGKRITVYPM